MFLPACLCLLYPCVCISLSACLYFFACVFVSLRVCVCISSPVCLYFCLCVCICFPVCLHLKTYFQVSEHLVEANLQSVDSHGVVRLTQYTDQVFGALCSSKSLLMLTS